jgi:hypothetical protein
MNRIEGKTFLTTLNITVPTTAQLKFFVNQKIPTQIKVIYGLSVQVDGVDPDNAALITLANSSDMYLTIVQGSDIIIEDLRLSDAVYLPDPDGTGAIPFPERRFLPIWIEGNINLDKSYFRNPVSIVAGRILLNFWYIPKG